MYSTCNIKSFFKDEYTYLSNNHILLKEIETMIAEYIYTDDNDIVYHTAVSEPTYVATRYYLILDISVTTKTITITKTQYQKLSMSDEITFKFKVTKTFTSNSNTDSCVETFETNIAEVIVNIIVLVDGIELFTDTKFAFADKVVTTTTYKINNKTKKSTLIEEVKKIETLFDNYDGKYFNLYFNI